MKTLAMFLVIVWFVFGVSAAHDEGYFDGNAPRTCQFVGSAALTVIAGPIAYFDVLHPKAYC